MGRYSRLRRIRQLDPQQDFERSGQKRYDDTVLMTYEMVREGTDSEHGRAAARQLNRIHGRYPIPNEDFLYVLATTVVGPKRWIDRFGWRRLCEQETESLALMGRRMGEMMGISGVPGTYAGFERLHDDYEREMFAYHPANRRVAAAALRVLASWYPAPVRRLVSRVPLAVLDEPLLKALGFAPEPRWLRVAVHRAFRTRAALIRLLPARPEWFPRKPKARTYPFGWTLDDLGPHWAHSRPPTPHQDETPTEGPSAKGQRSADGPSAPPQIPREGASTPAQKPTDGPCAQVQTPPGKTSVPAQNPRDRASTPAQKPTDGPPPSHRTPGKEPPPRHRSP
jgi:hypothetical protein